MKCVTDDAVLWARRAGTVKLSVWRHLDVLADVTHLSSSSDITFLVASLLSERQLITKDSWSLLWAVHDPDKWRRITAQCLLFYDTLLAHFRCYCHWGVTVFPKQYLKLVLPSAHIRITAMFLVPHSKARCRLYSLVCQIQGGARNVIPFYHPIKIVTSEFRCCKHAI